MVRPSADPAAGTACYPTHRIGRGQEVPLHEVAIAESLIRQTTAEAARLGLAVVRGVGVRLGEQSGLTADALVTAFEVLRDGPLAGAILEVRMVPGADLQLAWVEGD